MGSVTNKSKQKQDIELFIYLKLKDCFEKGVFTHKWKTFTSLYSLSAGLV